MDQNNIIEKSEETDSDYYFRECPECGFTTIKGMPGGRDSTCTNCGYKDPCCYDY